MKHIKLIDLPEVGVQGSPDIKKKVILEKGYIPNLMTFGYATFLPGQKKELHKHNTAFEVFYILSGKAKFVVDEKEIEVKKDETVTIEPAVLHEMSNPFSETVTWLYFVIASE